jgi:glycosidase
VWLTALGTSLGRRATLDDIPDAELDRLAALGFDWIWLLSVWQTGDAGRQVSLHQPAWRQEFARTLPDIRDEDIGGSGFAITDYSVHRALGGDSALARLRQRLRARGIRLMLDFMPNHVGLDHPWLEQRPDYFLHATLQDLAKAPQNYTRIQTPAGPLVLAHGRDPNFDGWPDTLQLDYSNPSVHDAMLTELLKIAGQCDGVRCDMAMLLVPHVFETTWGLRIEPFWPDAIGRVRDRVPGFTFMAEVYWDLEWELQQQGFDYTYDKRLYDRLVAGDPGPVREHLGAPLDFQNRLARFLENHDEPRAAAVFAPQAHMAAAAITFLSPGLRFFHAGQLEGHRTKVSPHLIRGPLETRDPVIADFYEKLLQVLRRPVVRSGRWQLLECVPEEGAATTPAAVIAWAWSAAGGPRLFVTVNYSPDATRCIVRLPFEDLGGRMWRLADLFGSSVHERHGDDLASVGFRIEVPPWAHWAMEMD